MLLKTVLVQVGKLLKYGYWDVWSDYTRRCHNRAVIEELKTKTESLDVEEHHDDFYFLRLPEGKSSFVRVRNVPSETTDSFDFYLWVEGVDQVRKNHLYKDELIQLVRYLHNAAKVELDFPLVIATLRKL